MNLSRRDFLKVAGFSLATLAFKPSVDKFFNAYSSPSKRLGSGSWLSSFPPEKFTVKEADFIFGASAENPLKLHFFPIHNNSLPDFYNEVEKRAAEVESFPLAIPTKIRNLYLPGDLLPNQVLAGVPNVMAGKNIVLAELPKRNYWENEGQTAPFSRDWVESFTLLSPFYPNKNKNILIALKALSDYQDESGGFPAGAEISMLEILNFEKGAQNYFPGKTSTQIIVLGGGVCAFVTLTARINIGSGATQTIEQWNHPTEQLYESSLLAGKKYSKRYTDATVELSPDGKRFDYRWAFTGNERFYYHIYTQVIPTGSRAEDLDKENADAFLAVTMALSSKRPAPNQGELLAAQLAEYEGLRRSEIQPKSAIALRSWERGSELHQLLDGVVPVEDVTPFETQFRQDEALKLMAELRSGVDSFMDLADREGLGLGTYLKSTDWYQKVSKTERLESAMRVLDQQSSKTPEQPFQCITLITLLASLDYEGKPFNAGGLPVRTAKELIPKEIYSHSVKEKFVTNGGYLVFKVPGPEEINLANAGDSFVQDMGTAGHIGVVLKKVSDPQRGIVLLCADANAANDGRVRIFTVDKNSWDFKFGPYPRPSLFIKAPS